MPLFQTLSKADLAATGEQMRPRTFSRGDVIIRQGDKGEEFFVIVKGTAEVTIQGPAALFLCELLAGKSYGQTSSVKLPEPMAVNSWKETPRGKFLQELI